MTDVGWHWLLVSQCLGANPTRRDPRSGGWHWLLVSQCFGGLGCPTALHDLLLCKAVGHPPKTSEKPCFLGVSCVSGAPSKTPIYTPFSALPGVSDTHSDRPDGAPATPAHRTPHVPQDRLLRPRCNRTTQALASHPGARGGAFLRSAGANRSVQPPSTQRKKKLGAPTFATGPAARLGRQHGRQTVRPALPGRVAVGHNHQFGDRHLPGPIGEIRPVRRLRLNPAGLKRGEAMQAGAPQDATRTRPRPRGCTPMYAQVRPGGLSRRDVGLPGHCGPVQAVGSGHPAGATSVTAYTAGPDGLLLRPEAGRNGGDPGSAQTYRTGRVRTKNCHGARPWCGW